jgi:hypothetical protein
VNGEVVTGVLARRIQEEALIYKANETGLCSITQNRLSLDRVSGFRLTLIDSFWILRTTPHL